VLFAILLGLMFGISTMCFASPMSAITPVSSGMPEGGCHGHHGPMPSPAHTCCFAAHQVPAATPIAPPPMAMDAVASDLIYDLLVGESDAGVPAPVSLIGSSPPLTTVLRI
jgi:hypothetical protein